MLTVFGRRRHFRSEVSVIADALRYLEAQRGGASLGVPIDELPITQGICALIADTIGSMTLYAVDAAGNRVDQLPNVLAQPNPEEDVGETLHKLVQSMFWDGNGYALVGSRDPRSGEVDAITVLDPTTVTYVEDPANRLRVLEWNVEGYPRRRGEVAVWPYQNNPLRGPIGETPLRRCRTALDAYGYAYSYLGDYFTNGGNPSHSFRSKLELSDTKITELVDEWIAARRTHRPPFIPSWLEYDVPPTSGELAAVVAVLEFASAETARMLNVPVSLVNAPVAGYTLQYSNVADEFRRWLVVSLRTTWIKRIERGFTTLCPRGLRARLDTSELFDELEHAATTTSAQEQVIA